MGTEAQPFEHRPPPHQAPQPLSKAAARASDWLRVQQTVRAFDELRPDLRRGPAAAEVAELARLVEERRSR